MHVRIVSEARSVWCNGKHTWLYARGYRFKSVCATHVLGRITTMDEKMKEEVDTMLLIMVVLGQIEEEDIE